MTSITALRKTIYALLVGVLSRLGAKPQAAIPSRQSEGYGLNAVMVERLAEQGVKLLVTVDNGISAREALERADALGLEVIVTDHHTIPPQRPPLLAIRSTMLSELHDEAPCFPLEGSGK